MCVKVVFAVQEVTRFEAIYVEWNWLPSLNKTQNKGLYNTLNTPQLKSIIAVLYVASIKPIFVRTHKRVPFKKFENYIWKVLHIYVTCTGGIKLFEFSDEIFVQILINCCDSHHATYLEEMKM